MFQNLAVKPFERDHKESLGLEERTIMVFSEINVSMVNRRPRTEIL